MNGRTNSIKDGDTIINGALIPLEPPTNLEFVPRNQAVRITWEDPLDKYTTPGDDLVTAWDHTLLIRKEGSAPSSPTDGVEVLKETTRNQYIENFYTDENLTNGITYHYALYAYGTNGTVSDPTISSVEARTGVPVYYQEIEGLSFNFTTRHPATGTVGSKYIFIQNPGNFYDKDLTRNIFSLENVYDNIMSADLTDYAIFTGGTGYNPYPTYSDRIYNQDAYDVNMTHSYFGTNTRWNGPHTGGTGTSTGQFAFFEGESDEYGQAVSNELVVTEINGIYSTHDEIFTPAAASLNGYAIFAGGNNRSFGSEKAWDTSTRAYNNNITAQSIADLTNHIVYPIGASNSNYAIFSGSVYGEYQRISEAYDQNLTKVAASSIISPPAYVEDLMYSAFTGVHLGTYCIFSWSAQSNSVYNTNLVMYDEDLTYIYKDDIIPATTDEVWCSVAKDPYGLFLSSSNELHVLTT